MLIDVDTHSCVLFGRHSHRAPREKLNQNAFTRKWRHRDAPAAVLVDMECVLDGDVQLRIMHQASSANKA